MSPLLVSAVFEFGYGCATLPKPLAGKFVQGIGWRRDQLAYLAREIHPNAFLALQQTLNELEKCGGDLDDLLDSEVDDLFEGFCEPLCANGDPLEDVYDKWMERATHFQTVAAGGLEESPCWDWFQRGCLLGQYEILGRGRAGPDLGLNTLKYRVAHIPEALLKHDEDESLNSVRTCSTRLADFDFAKEGIEAWVREVSREDFSRTETHNLLGVKDFRSLMGHVRYDIMVLIRKSPLEKLLSDSPPSPTPAEANKDAGAAEPAQDWRSGYLGLEFDDGGKIVLHAGEDVEPPTFKWDADKQQILINDVPLDQYEGAVISDSGWDKTTFERNAWLYVKCLEGVPYATICSKMKTLCAELNKIGRKWRAISSEQGVQVRASAFAKRLGLPELPPRQIGRPPRRSRQ